MIRTAFFCNLASLPHSNPQYVIPNWIWYKIKESYMIFNADDGKYRFYRYISALWCQKQVPQAGKSNYIPQYSVECNYLSMPTIPVSGAKVHFYHGGFRMIYLPIFFSLTIRYWCCDCSSGSEIILKGVSKILMYPTAAHITKHAVCIGHEMYLLCNDGLAQDCSNSIVNNGVAAVLR